MLLRWFGRLIAESYEDLGRSLGLLPPESLDLMVDAAALVAVAEGREDSRRVARSEATEALAVARQLGNLDRLGMEAARERFESTVAELHAGGEAARRRSSSGCARCPRRRIWRASPCTRPARSPRWTGRCRTPNRR